MITGFFISLNCQYDTSVVMLDAGRLMPKLLLVMAKLLAARFDELVVTYRLKLLTVVPPIVNG